jgi:ketosteroid isomerase-like protein
MVEAPSSLPRRTIVQWGLALLALWPRGILAAQPNSKTGDDMQQPSATVKKLFAEAQTANQDWMDGKPTYADMMAHSEGFTIAGPFGGPAMKGWTEQSAIGQARTATQFKGGKTSIELVNSHESGDLVVLIMTERGEATFEGYDTPQAWSLRSTQIYKRTGDRWLIVHRHADPLVERRTLHETISLVAKRETY